MTIFYYTNVLVNVMKTCPQCGNLEKDDSSRFCQNCGNQLPSLVGSSPQNLSRQENVVFQNRRSGKRSHGLGIGIGLALIALVLLGTFFVGNNLLGVNYTKIGENTYIHRLTSDTASNLSLTIVDNLGDVQITTSNLDNFSYEITQTVYSRSSSTKLSSAVPVKNHIIPGEIQLTFDTSDNLKYDFNIVIGAKMKIKDLSINTQVGNIQISLYNQTVSSFKAISSTGNVFSTFSSCTFAVGEGVLQTKVGNSQLELSGSTFLSNRTWNITSATGGVSTFVDVSATYLTHQTFNLASNIGTVILTRGYHPPVHEFLFNEVSTGKITVDGVTQNSGTNFYGTQNQVNSPSIFEYHLKAYVGDIIVN